MGIGGDFYEDDEPIEDVIQAFETGEHGVTGPSQHGWTQYLDVGSAEVTETTFGRAFGEQLANH